VEQAQRAVGGMEAERMVVEMEVEGKEEADVVVVDTAAVGTEAVGTEAMQAAASASRASTEAKDQEKICRCRRCLQAICSTLPPSMGQPVRVAIPTGELVITGAGDRIKPRKGIGVTLEKLGSRETIVGIQRMMWRIWRKVMKRARQGVSAEQELLAPQGMEARGNQQEGCRLIKLLLAMIHHKVVTVDLEEVIMGPGSREDQRLLPTIAKTTVTTESIHGRLKES